MLCEKCKKNEANVSIQTMINGVSESHNLCSECAQKDGIFNSGLGFDNFPIANNIGKILFNFPYAQFGDAKSNVGVTLDPEVYCPNCNQSLSDFKQTGLFGCSQCYVTFREMIRNMLDQIQGDHLHHDTERKTLAESEASDLPLIIVDGDSDRLDSSRRTKIAEKEDKPVSEKDKLQAELRKMIEQENYEQAAVLRDKLKALAENDQAADKEHKAKEDHSSEDGLASE